MCDHLFLQTNTRMPFQNSFLLVPLSRLLRAFDHRRLTMAPVFGHQTFRSRSHSARTLHPHAMDAVYFINDQNHEVLVRKDVQLFTPFAFRVARYLCAFSLPSLEQLLFLLQNQTNYSYRARSRWLYRHFMVSQSRTKAIHLLSCVICARVDAIRRW